MTRPSVHDSTYQDMLQAIIHGGDQHATLDFGLTRGAAALHTGDQQALPVQAEALGQVGRHFLHRDADFLANQFGVEEVLFGD